MIVSIYETIDWFPVNVGDEMAKQSMTDLAVIQELLAEWYAEHAQTLYSGDRRTKKAFEQVEEASQRLYVACINTGLINEQ